MNGREWEELLLGATSEVMKGVSKRARGEGRGKTLGVGASGDKTILADKEAEDVILGALKDAGGVKVLSEEAGAAGDSSATLLAVVDPLDGSSNFERGIPFYCTSVALVEGKRLSDITLGVVRDLVCGDVYVGRRGGGAFKNGRRIRTSRVASPSQAVVGIDMSRSAPELVASLSSLVAGVKRQVHLGANALEVCYLAEGKTDAFVDVRGKIRITDFAAAYLIAKEAGAVFTDGRGGELDPQFDLVHRFSFVGAANGELHGEIMSLLGEEAGGANPR